MFRGYELRQRVVIDVNTAERLGVVADVEIDESTGMVSRIIVHRRGALLARLFGWGELALPWRAITAAGREFVLVDTLILNESCLSRSENKSETGFIS